MGMNPFGRELFFYQVYNFADLSDRSLSKAEFYFSMVNDILTFIKTGDTTFTAKYELNILFRNKKGEPVGYRTINDEVVVNRFEDTNSRRQPIRHQLQLSLPPGVYEYSIQLMDAEAKQILEQKTYIQLRDFGQDRLRLSDIVFANETDCQTSFHQFTPNLRDHFDGTQPSFTAYFEVYPPKGNDKIFVEYNINNASGKQVFSGRDVYIATESPIPKCISFRDSLDKPGEYTIIVKAKLGEQSIKQQRSFFVQWGKASPFSGQSMDLAVEELSLIAKKDEIQKIKAADGDEKKALLDEFWQKRDPTPGTPRNELRDEFLRRVDFANQNFSEWHSRREGWSTDRGEVYIKNGPPDQVERQPTEINMPSAEIWYYSKLNLRYIFSDRNGSGEYRLVKVE